MSSTNLQEILDKLADGEVLNLGTVPGASKEFKGPLIIRKPAVIEGQGSTIWALTGPVVQIESRGVELRDLRVEITSRDDKLSGDSVCALKIKPGLMVNMNNVAVRGTVLGLPQEEGTWQLPRNVPFGTLAAGMPHEFRLKIIVPVPCTVTSEIDGLKVSPP